MFVCEPLFWATFLCLQHLTKMHHLQHPSIITAIISRRPYRECCVMMMHSLHNSAPACWRALLTMCVCLSDCLVGLAAAAASIHLSKSFNPAVQQGVGSQSLARVAVCACCDRAGNGSVVSVWMACPVAVMPAKRVCVGWLASVC